MQSYSQKVEGGSDKPYSMLNCFVAKFVGFFWRFTLFCRKIWFAAIRAFVGENFRQI